MTDKATHLVLQIDDQDADAEELAELTGQLRAELLNLDVTSVKRAPAGSPPPGTRAVDLGAVARLIASYATPEVLTAILAAVRSWLGGTTQRRIRLEVDGDLLELTGVSSTEQRRLADEWLRRHAA
jgi:hypothetical protein